MAEQKQIVGNPLARVGLCLLAGVLAVAAGAAAQAAGGNAAKAESRANAPVLDYLYGWGEPGTGTGKFRAVRGIVAYNRKDSQREVIVVADGGADMLRSYTWDMMFIDKWGQAGDKPGEFHEPRGVAIDGNGYVVVVDALNHRVQKTQVGTTSFLERPGIPVLAFGKRGSGDGEFETPTGVAVDAQGNIIVVDTDNHRVQVFDGQGKFQFAFGKRGNGNGEFYKPSHIEIDAKGRLFVSDTGNNRIQIFDAKGKFLSSIGSVGSEPGLFAEPKGIALDKAGNLWVVDRRNHRLQKFGPDGRFAGVYGKQGGDKGEFSFPEDMTFDASGRLYVTDGMNGRIQVFKPST
ncbi:MAG TPA: NHL repeat-containing protein [Tahibacter sp.]|nr:NHL repeat-containing protein [Tahibacter sp.]